ncbi:hypothetical protein JAO76_10255 [Pontibacter sp. BT310]|uniref:Haem-binding uptake Tiki superfamily ChaN domain-containing protein n=1 Tax=Pontibacter populi TaxID=890055 RepID=A0ABS6XBR1_9BACT|nr:MULTISPECIES: hypothetical protein [Pontibacter]MBJ6118575.1 hypothetical protein [Pontibacter sp. BT310]MBR0571004.1 hypothetical protein [Microvirga sp. STS03]MBW3365429.1 hypothetical protein [Pontibacter populi]
MKKLFLVLIPVFLILHADVHAQGQLEESCEQKLISYLNWKETPNTKWSLILNGPTGTKLNYIGARHSDDAADPQFKVIREAWQAQKPTLAFFEGPDRGTADSETETIKQFGESGYVRYLAKEAGIKTQSLEPSPQDEVRYLLSLKKFTPEQIKLFFILREASRLRDRKGLNEEELKATIAQLLVKANKLLPDLATVIPDTNALQTAYEKYWTTPANWWQAPAGWFDPLKNGAETGGKFTNDINRHNSEFRNLHMYRIITEAVSRGEKVFAVVGRNHVPMQAAAISCALR